MSASKLGICMEKRVEYSGQPGFNNAFPHSLKQMTANIVAFESLLLKRDVGGFSFPMQSKHPK
jgi:hypothetical protein